MRTLAIVLLVAATLLFVIVAGRFVEPFGTSPGTLVQLSSSHVPTQEDVDEERALRQQIIHDMIDLNGSA
jgi:hypothetical protein